MTTRLLILMLFTAVLALAVAFIWPPRNAGMHTTPVEINGTVVPPLPRLEQSQITLGEALYLQNCAACHGVDLQGSANWNVPLQDGKYPPPPHDDSGHTWHHSDFILEQIVSQGGASVYSESAMPAFGHQLTDEEIRAIFTFIKSRWKRESREYQWWITNTFPTPTPSP